MKLVRLYIQSNAHIFAITLPEIKSNNTNSLNNTFYTLPIEAPKDKVKVNTNKQTNNTNKDNKNKKAKDNNTSSSKTMNKIDPTTTPIYRLKICIGQIKSAKIHPEDPRLLVETIDVGEDEPRQVISGIAEFITIDQFIGSYVLCCMNLRPGNIKGIDSNGRVLVATSDDGKTKEILTVKNGQIGDIIVILMLKKIKFDEKVNGKYWNKIVKN